ncbi:MAG: alpha/beta hydrolase [Ignavibacteriae bacterium]|nr:alpha/beta hydrolase [Ignavibacteriota bacterium]
MKLNKYFIVPGLGNSGSNHWQTFFEKSELNCKRINQLEWNSPICEDWIQTIDKEIMQHNLNDCVIIGHSLGCATIVHWAIKYKRIIKGALLVAPSDLEAENYTFPAKGFSPIPREKMNFKTIIVASNNDKWIKIERAKYFAECWGSEFINIGNAGHINVDSGYGNWYEGIEILKKI